MGVMARVRDLLARAAAGPLDPADIAARAADLEEVRARVERLRAMGVELELAPELEALLAPSAAA